MNKYTTILIFFHLISTASFSQNEAVISVLKKKEIGKVYDFDSSSKEGIIDKISIRYLGHIKTAKGQLLNILSWSRIWGRNHHTTGIIYLYDDNYSLIGKYNLGSNIDLPYKVQSADLVFTNKNKGSCDTSLITKISFYKGIPQSIFLKCKGDLGDIYSFSAGE